MLPAVQLKARPLKPCYWIKLAWSCYGQIRFVNDAVSREREKEGKTSRVRQFVDR